MVWTFFFPSSDFYYHKGAAEYEMCTVVCVNLARDIPVRYVCIRTKGGLICVCPVINTVVTYQNCC